MAETRQLSTTGHRTARGSAPQPANLADLLDRVLDKGIVVAGDIRVNIADVELLSIKLRLLVASVDTAREMGIDWWEHDRFLSRGPVGDRADDEHGDAGRRGEPSLEAGHRELEDRLDRIEALLERRLGEGAGSS